ncbi:MAG: DUF134 domain-containing protein [Prolixibacteraceae bacterium]|nr:DUF134 domain-containing protein [Prolixibacteraceae bacterium]
MSRRKLQRKIITPPTIKGISVFGLLHKKSEKIRLFLEEYESIRLLDFENMTQEEAAIHMEVSRPTLTRIYENARKKVARSLVEGVDVVISGGEYLFDESWYRCESCKANFNIFEGTEHYCPVCKSTEIISLNQYYSS